MKYGNKHSHMCDKCGETTYFFGEDVQRVHPGCGGIWREILDRVRCPVCKNIVKRISPEQLSVQCKACGEAVVFK